MNINPLPEPFKVHDAEIRWNLFNWPYCWQIHYDNSSVIMSLRTKAEARKYANVEHERRAELIMKKLKDD